MVKCKWLEEGGAMQYTAMTIPQKILLPSCLIDKTSSPELIFFPRFLFFQLDLLSLICLLLSGNLCTTLFIFFFKKCTYSLLGDF